MSAAGPVVLAEDATGLRDWGPALPPMRRYRLYTEDRVHRFALRYSWEVPERPRMTVILLNPAGCEDGYGFSVTDRHVCQAAIYRGYGGVSIYNVFSAAARTPDELAHIHPRTLAEHDLYVAEMLAWQHRVFVGWGASPLVDAERLAWLRTVLDGMDVRAFAVNIDGSPRHPRFTPADRLREDVDYWLAGERSGV